jgi:hypothetical protein
MFCWWGRSSVEARWLDLLTLGWQVVRLTLDSVGDTIRARDYCDSRF